MRRFTTAVSVLAVIGLAALAVAVSVATAAGPRCADITGEQHNYSTQGTLSFALLLAGAADVTTSTPCKSVTYTLTISGISGGPLTVTQKGDSTFEGVEFSDTDNNICVSATATSSGGKVHDAAPDAGCLEISVGPSGGSGGFN